MEEKFKSFRATILEFEKTFLFHSFFQVWLIEEQGGEASSSNIFYQIKNFFVPPIPQSPPTTFHQNERIHINIRWVKYFVSNISWESENLLFFYRCIHKWSHSLDVFPLILNPLVIKIESCFKSISIKLKKHNHRLNPRDSQSPTREARERFFQNWILEFFDDFYSDISNIRSLKSEIKQALDSFHKSVLLSVFYGWQDFDIWQDFVQSTISNLESLVSHPNRTGVSPERRNRLLPDFSTKISCFSQMISEFVIFGHLARIFRRNPDLKELMLQLGTVVMCAALMYCKCWSMGMDPELDKMKAMANTLLDLQMEIKSITPRFVDLVLKQYILNGGHVDDESVDLIVKCLLGSKNPKFLCVKLIALIKHYINLSQPQGNPVDLQSFVVNVKQVIMRARSRQIIRQNTYETSNELVDILTMIWLVKVEIFLRYQLHSPGSLSVNDQDRILKELATVSWTNHFNPVDNAEKVHQILTLQEEVATVLASIRDSFLAEVTPTEMLNSIIFKLLISIMLFKAKSSLMNLLSDNDSSIDALAGQIKSLTESLEFLKIHVNNLPVDKLQDGKSVFNNVDDLCGRIYLHYYSDPNNRIADHIKKFVPDLVADIKLITYQLRQVYCFVSMCKIPKTDRIGFLDTLLGKLREWLNSKHVLLSRVKHLVEEILESLELLTHFIKDKQGQGFGSQDSQEFATHVLKLAYQIEYVFDSMSVGDVAEWHNFIWAHHLLEDSRHLKLQVSTYRGGISYEIKADSAPQISSPTVSHDKTSGLEKLVVGLNDQEEEIITKLTRGSMHRDIASIIGMPGIGKTTLAKEVYNNIKVQYHFHVHAWCYVSQYYEKRRLLLDILTHFSELAENMLEKTDDLELQLYQRLKGKRYLIVMDDMWDTGAWDDLRRSLPDDENGSRILITSRLKLPLITEDIPHELRLLSVDESWDLLQRKIFYDKYCPEDLKTVGKDIARSCSGLPLSIVAVAGLLKKTDKTVASWKAIEESINSLILMDTSTRCMAILELSYNDLPDHLKACYLYFGALSADKHIPAFKLIYLWMAEGLVKKAEPCALQDIAESYLKDLINRSLVTITKRRSNGGVKACRIHDLLLDFCLKKANEENFFQLVTRNEEPYATFDHLDYLLDIDDYPSGEKYDNYRVCIQAKREHFIKSRPSGPGVRSLQFYASAEEDPRCPYDFSFISENFKLLKVLDVECINMGISFPRGLESLIHLRYLAVSGYIDCVPSYISNLENLETLLVNGLKGRVVLPDTLWFMRRLRHLHVNKHVVFSLPDKKPDKFSRLENLVTLSCLHRGKDINLTLRRLPGLKKLRCMVSESRNHMDLLRLDMLSQLESLTMIFYGRAPSSSAEFTLPCSLKKLTLSNFRLPWNLISESGIGRLGNLEVLKLSNAFQGETWDMVDGEFSKLKFLKLDSLDIVHWNAYSDHLPNLEQLVVQNCGLLEEVPSFFSDIPTLQTIKLKRCTLCCEESVRRIEEEVEVLEVIISFSASSAG